MLRLICTFSLIQATIRSIRFAAVGFLTKGPAAVNNRSISSAATQITSQSLGDVLHRRLRFVPQQSVHGHHHPWSAEATLGAVSLRYSLLNRVDPGLGAADALHGGDGGSVELAERQEAGVS